MKRHELAKMIAFPLIAAAVVFLISHFFFVPVNNNLSNYALFYREEKNSLDVVLIGNSTVRSGFIPTYAWKNYGYTSYSLSAAPTHPEVIKIAIDEVGKTQTPKVVYIDINGLTYQRYDEQKRFVHAYIDSMPEGESRKALSEEYDYSPQTSTEDGFFKYHNQFRNPDYFLPASWKYSEHNTVSIMKGYYAVAYSTVIEPCLVADPSIIKPLPDDGVNYLYEILEACKKYPDINFVFGKMPRFLTETTIDATYQLRSAKPIIEGYGYTFVDFYDKIEEIGLDNKTDQYDAEHMNHNGALKFTRYFSQYIIDEFGLVAHEHGHHVVHNYDVAYEKYDNTIKLAQHNLSKHEHKQSHLIVNEALAFHKNSFSSHKLFAVLIVVILIISAAVVIKIVSVIKKKKNKTIT